MQNLQISNKKALELIILGEIFINGKAIKGNINVSIEDTIEYKNEVLQEGKKLRYYAFYKPRGIETTLNEEIENNLKSLLSFDTDIFPVGRLDKESEGLLLLTNDGSLYDKILRKEYAIEKEYLVQTDKVISDEFIEKMANGVKIMGKMTLPCKVNKIDDFCFSIILVQGLNRQIRRMCYKLGYEVFRLKRIRIGAIGLGDLKAGEYRTINDEEL